MAGDRWQGSRRDILKAVGAGSAVLVLGRVAPAEAAFRTLAHHYDAAVLHGWMGALYTSQRDARALPPAAARLYGLSLLAGYEAAVEGIPNRRSLGGRLNGLGASPARPQEKLIWPVAVNAAIRRVAVAASFDRAQPIRDALDAHGAATHRALASGHPPKLVARSAEHGATVGAWIAEWADTDGYAATRGLAYDPPTGPGMWVPTPPNFGAAIEPHWHRVRPFALAVRRDPSGAVIDPAAPPPPLPFDATPGSPFHRQATTVYEVSKSVTDAQKAVALHWRDNPDGVTGLPSGHWLQITSGVAADLGLDLAATAELMALVAIAVADGFTSCWIEKYRSNVLRPVTYIRAHIDSTWSSIVNSPAFPEYTSGHSVGSGAAAAALAALLGERRFTDRSVEGRVIEGVALQPRSFSSFAAAADEAAVSRLYGGIHYPMAIEAGLLQGREVARQVLRVARTRPGGGK